MLHINSNITIPARELAFQFARSSGPGGQNVNKVNSKALLSWTPANSEAIPAAVLARLLMNEATRLTKNGELLISSQKYRDQGRNIADCLDKLRQIVLAATVVPKKRRPTQATQGSKRRRLESKRRDSVKKQLRGGRNLEK
jgi:ribosome-associated protein